jgi:hypothetical protein
MSNDNIFGYSWSDIQRAQQGGRLSRPIDTSKQSHDYSESDRALLAEHGEQGLRDMGYFGVLDRLNLL